MNLIKRWMCHCSGGCLLLGGMLLPAQEFGPSTEPAIAVSSGVPSETDASGHAALPVQSRISLLSQAGHLEPVVEILENLLIQYQKSGDRAAEAGVLCSLGNSYDLLGQQQKATDAFQRALAIYRAAGDKPNEASELLHIGNVYRSWGFPEIAVRFYRDALRLHTQFSDNAGRADVLNNLGVTYLSLSDKKKSLDYLNEARTAYKQVGDQHSAALALINIGAAETLLVHDHQRAIDMLGRAIAELEPLDDRANQADAFEMLGVVWAGLHKQDAAGTNFRRALDLYRQAKDAKGEASVLKRLTELHSLDDVASMR